MQGSSRWVTNWPAKSTTIQARSNSSPVSISRLSVSATPPQDLMGYTCKEWMVTMGSVS